ncbi:MAG: hypothetical protein K2Y29_20880 [Beijerinckiaceae bacterium]|nr:hypothetical protein [Beijerinckiaceae bacterium]
MSAQTVHTFMARVGATGFAVAVVMLAQGAATPASAGLLDFLFGRPQPQPVFVAPPPAQKPRPRVVREEPKGPRPYVAPEVVAGPLGRFLRDPSLRRGDVVATPNGLMIFQGAGGSTNHRMSDFVPVQSARTVAGARRNDLVLLDRTMRSTPANIVFVAEAPEPKTLVIAKRADNMPGGALEARAEIGFGPEQPAETASR